MIGEYSGSLVLTDMRLPGNPMVYVSDEFCAVTGYSRQEVLGQNCRLLQGPQTEPAAVAAISEAIRAGVDCHVKVTNYRKDGSTFENLLCLRPVHDSNGVFSYCIGLQLAVTDVSTAEADLADLAELMGRVPSPVRACSSRPSARVHRPPSAMSQPQPTSKDPETAALLLEALDSHFIFHSLPSATKSLLVDLMHEVTRNELIITYRS